MRFKKFISGLLTAALLVGLLPAALAAGEPTVSISSGTVKAGELVTLTVSIKDNPGLATYMLFFYYDTSVFEMDVERDMASAGGFRNGMLLGNTIALAKENNSYRGLPGKEGTIAGWFALSDVAADGDVMTVTLRAKKEIPNGEYTIGLGYSKEDTSNVNGTLIDLKTNSAVVTVIGGTGTKPPETQQPENTVPVFPDAQGHWAQEYIEKAAQLGLILGNEYGMYMPDKTMTRAECVTILWRACGAPKATKAAPFTDLDPDQTWYHEAAAWSAENGVIKGTGDGTTFSPYDNVNRDQLATILFRLAGGKSGMEGMLSGIYNDAYSDSGKIADWAKQGVYWSIYNEILCGESSVTLGRQLKPGAPANRGQIAVMIVRWLELDSYDRDICVITFDMQGGSALPDMEAVWGAAVTRPADPSRYGFTFGGWYADSACTQEYTFDTMPRGGATVYAKWISGDEGRSGVEYVINGILLRNASTYEPVSGIPTGKLLAEISVTNLCSVHTDTVMLVTYDKDGRMLEMGYLYAGVPVGGTFTFGMEVDNSGGEVGEIKAFVLSALNGMLPLAEAKSCDGM